MSRVDGLDDTDRKILLYVAAHRDLHDEGPTWKEIREALELPPRIYSVPDPLIFRIRRLKYQRHLSFDYQVPRSTDIKRKTRNALGMGRRSATAA